MLTRWEAVRLLGPSDIGSPFSYFKEYGRRQQIEGDNDKATDEKTTAPVAADAPSATGEPTTSENQ